MTFDERLHTPSALTAEISGLYKRDHDTLLVGSIGRSVLFRVLTGNPEVEFQARTEDPLQRTKDGQTVPRDIDIVTAVQADFKDLKPFPVDQYAFSNRQVSVVNDRGEWYLNSDSKKIYTKLHPAVMEPVEGEGVYGIPGATVPFQTQEALFGLRGAIRPKDEQSLQLLTSMAKHNKNWLPEELYEPFDQIRLLANSGLVHNTRRIYRAVVPMSLRSKVAPLTYKILERLA